VPSRRRHRKRRGSRAPRPGAESARRSRAPSPSESARSEPRPREPSRAPRQPSGQQPRPLSPALQNPPQQSLSVFRQPTAQQQGHPHGSRGSPRPLGSSLHSSGPPPAEPDIPADPPPSPPEPPPAAAPLPPTPLPVAPAPPPALPPAACAPPELVSAPWPPLPPFGGEPPVSLPPFEAPPFETPPLEAPPFELSPEVPPELDADVPPFPAPVVVLGSLPSSSFGSSCPQPAPRAAPPRTSTLNHRSIRIVPSSLRSSGYGSFSRPRIGILNTRLFVFSVHSPSDGPSKSISAKS
jgi:hypothetical protein